MTEQLSQTQPSQGQNENLHAIGFKVGAEEYGLSLSAIQETITLRRITRVPKAAPYIKGVINLHGNVIPVIDVARRLGTGETAAGAGSRIVVVETETEVVGLLAERVSSVTRLAPSSVQPPPAMVAGIAAEYLEGVARLPDRFLIFLNLTRVMADDGGLES